MYADHLNIGLLAHVDAGKTTTAESILYSTGKIRSRGRVDHQDAFLDTYALEKERGITIFSKMAQIPLGGLQVTLVDTPGHVDFSAEMERTLQVLDYALVVISAPDGVQGHVRTLWKLLKAYRIPVFFFVNKMDQPGTNAGRVMQELKRVLGDECISFAGADFPGETYAPGDKTVSFNEEAAEEIAMCDEEALSAYLQGEGLKIGKLRDLVKDRKLFPCFFGSALKQEGIDRLLEGIGQLVCRKEYPDVFSARVYKIIREGNTRLSFMKITGGELLLKQVLTGRDSQGEEWEEKADQIRIYSGRGFSQVTKAEAGSICAVTGLSHTRAGEGLGGLKEKSGPLLEPVLTYSMLLEDGEDPYLAYIRLKQLEEEIPELLMSWQEETRTIHVRIMGQVQLEILRTLILERFGMTVDFDAGQIVYKETITDRVEGVGHFEPLRHYAEVHLLLEPGERGSGLSLASDCPVDALDLNWQRLVLTHLAERSWRGVLTGSELTDVKITLIAGRAHLKHTEGGDFRQATIRAVRQGLMQAQSILLEPVYSFVLEVPPETVGRAIADLQAMHGSFEGPLQREDMAVLTGKAPVARMQDYASAVRAYTSGRGSLSCLLQGFEPCHNTDEVCERFHYDPDADTSYPSGSVFCSHGAGVYVPWQEVKGHMHVATPAIIKRNLEQSRTQDTDLQSTASADRTGSRRPELSYEAGTKLGRELEEIFTRTYGSVSRSKKGWERQKRVREYHADQGAASENFRKKPQDAKPPVLLVDGYNIIYSWDDLKGLADDAMESARFRLMEILSNYQGFRQMEIILVFDAYRVPGGEEHSYRHHNIYVVFTKEAETADAYIERTVHKMARQCDVTVATSDGAEQVIILGEGARRQSASQLKEEILHTCREIQDQYLKTHSSRKRYLFENLSEDMAAFFEDLRLGKQ